MSLVDIMSEMKLHIFAEIALVIFIAVFIAVIVHVFRKRNRSTFDSARYMPLDDDNPQELRDPDEPRKGHGGRTEGVEG